MDEADASWLCQGDRVTRVTESGRRVYGTVDHITTKDLTIAWDDGTPWFRRFEDMQDIAAVPETAA